MRKATLTRNETSDEGTFGTLEMDSGFICRTGELPWRDNAPSVSCIPAGVYQCTWRESSAHGMCYHVEGVAGRTGVEIHAANWMGDEAKGYICELKGCIAPGMAVGNLKDQKAVTMSGEALGLLEADLESPAAQEPFELTIIGLSE